MTDKIPLLIDTDPGAGPRRKTLPMDGFNTLFVVANPWEVALSPDGKLLCAVFAGTDAIVRNAGRGGQVTHFGVALTVGLVVLVLERGGWRGRRWRRGIQRRSLGRCRCRARRRRRANSAPLAGTASSWLAACTSVSTYGGYSLSNTVSRA